MDGFGGWVGFGQLLNIMNNLAKLDQFSVNFGLSVAIRTIQYTYLWFGLSQRVPEVWNITSFLLHLLLFHLHLGQLLYFSIFVLQIMKKS